METLADQAPQISGKSFIWALIFIGICALALYFGGKRN